MNPKLQWLRNKMSSLDLQGLIVSNPINIRYLTNIEAEGILLLTRKERCNRYSPCHITLPPSCKSKHTHEYFLINIFPRK